MQINFEPNTHMRSVIINESPISIIPPTVSNLLNSEEITIRKTQVSSVDFNLFCTLHKLDRLKLSRNKITRIVHPSEAPCSPSLRVLELQYNLLEEINLDVFRTFEELEKINLNGNVIETLTGMLTNPKIRDLLLVNNRIKMLDFCNWQGIKVPNFSVYLNQLSRVPRCLYKVLAEGVTSVNLALNQIDRFEIDDLEQLPNFEVIDLSFNKIPSIPLNECLYPTKLRELRLFQNPIVSIPKGTFKVVIVGAIVAGHVESFILDCRKHLGGSFSSAS
ncbi:leucine-rich repeats and immunoglobulin-like domains protein sma-10 [Anopheles moucheti]|uniref:leucine-rich repeats and immunoglobulin-like domains protein sma-10 n=1 Tax=Anopheles moucheti TaxID=186751 RepID=UPI0022F03CC8|nr:leucine-rich repeats and immunoglobulin-like domains protein sma-10 [Anopheles moucheti]